MPIAKLSPEWLSPLGTFLTAIFAGIAVLVSIYIHHKATKYSRLTKRPIIAISKNRCTMKPSTGATPLQIEFNFWFANLGQHPADNLTLTIWAAPERNPSQLLKLFEQTVANKIHSQTTSPWDTTIDYKPPTDPSAKPVLLFCIRLAYHDGFTSTKLTPEFQYFAYIAGNDALGHASIEQKRLLKPHLDKLLSPEEN